MLDPKYFQEEKTFAQRLWMISSVCIFFWVSEMKGVSPIMTAFLHFDSTGT